MPGECYTAGFVFIEDPFGPPPPVAWADIIVIEPETAAGAEDAPDTNLGRL